MNYNEVFESDVNKNFYYDGDGYPSRKLMVGFISLDKAKARLSKGEYYALVECQGQEELPTGYVPLSQEYLQSMGMEEEKQFASVDPKFHLSAICQNGGIQLISQLPAPQGDARYLLGPGPGQVMLSDLIAEQIQAYNNVKTDSKAK